MAAIIFNVLPLIPYLFVFISYSLLWVGRQGFSLLRRRPLRRFLASRAALANAHAFTQLRALSGSNPRRGNKKAAGIRQSLFHSMVGRQGFEPWTLGLKVPCSAS